MPFVARAEAHAGARDDLNTRAKFRDSEERSAAFAHAELLFLLLSCVWFVTTAALCCVRRWLIQRRVCEVQHCTGLPCRHMLRHASFNDGRE